MDDVFADQDGDDDEDNDGKGVAPGIPNLAAQRQAYLIASLKEYKESKRPHAALRDMAANMSDADMRTIRPILTIIDGTVVHTTGVLR